MKSINIIADLWNFANNLRGKVEMSQFKSILLSLYIYKYISDRGEDAMYTNEDQKSSALTPRFKVQKRNTFRNLFANKEGKSFLDILQSTLVKIEQDNSPKLDGMFNLSDFNNLKAVEDQVWKEVLVFFENLNTEQNSAQSGFEALLEYLLLLEGKFGGAFQTPVQINQLLANLLSPNDQDTIYDPACGSGGLLLQMSKKQKPGFGGSNLFGQDINRSIFAIAKMNMIINELDNANLSLGDSLFKPAFTVSENELSKFDIVVSNPPFNSVYEQKRFKEEIFSKWGISPTTRTDFTFIQHMLLSANEKKGKVGVIVNHGVLFRGGADSQVRKNLINENFLEAVIGLPGNLLSYSTIPLAILIFKKGRVEKSPVLFIDASREAVLDKRKNLITDSGMERIVETYRSFQQEGSDFDKVSQIGFAAVCSPEEIEAKDYNLTINRYIEEGVGVKLDKNNLRAEIEELDKRQLLIRKEIKEKLNQLGIEKIKRSY